MARPSTVSSMFSSSSCGVLTETQSSLPASSLPLRPRSCDCMLMPLLQNKSPELPGSGFSQFSSLFQFAVPPVAVSRSGRCFPADRSGGVLAPSLVAGSLKLCEAPERITTLKMHFYSGRAFCDGATFSKNTWQKLLPSSRDGGGLLPPPHSTKKPAQVTF